MRDIDWKATARHTSPLVKRYVATRKQNLMLVVDTGRGMAATTRSGEPKSAVAICAAGLVGYLAQRHGDLVGLVRGTASSTVAHDLRGTETHLELLLRAIDAATSLDGEQSNLATQLRWIVGNVRRRLFLVVVADDRDLDPALDELLRRLHVQHEILWITVEDADPTAIGGDRTAYDVADGHAAADARAPRPQGAAGVCRLGRGARAAHRGAARPPGRSATPASARPTRSSPPSSPCSRGSAVRAADPPPPGFYAPDLYAARWLWIGVGVLALVVLWYVVVWCSTRPRRVRIPARVTPDRLSRLRADYTRQIDLVLDRAARGRDHPARAVTSSSASSCATSCRRCRASTPRR